MKLAPSGDPYMGRLHTWRTWACAVLPWPLTGPAGPALRRAELIPQPRTDALGKRESVGVKRILVVDDEETFVEFVGALLEDTGYRVHRAYDGCSALQIARSERPTK